MGVELDKGSGGKTVATDIHSSQEHQLVKLEFGDGASVQRVAAATPLPVTDFMAEVAKGSLSGHSSFHAFGLNEDVDTGAYEPICDAKAAYTGFSPTSAETLDLVSSSANDTSAGTGARTVTVSGLDGSYAAVSETIALNGTSAVTTTATFLRVHSVVVATAGSGDENAGTITIDNSTSGHVFCVMYAGANRSQIAAYTVPAGKTAYLVQSGIALADASNAYLTSKLWVRPESGVFQQWDQYTIQTVGLSGHDRRYSIPRGPITAKSDIYITGISSVSTAAVAAHFSLLLVDD